HLPGLAVRPAGCHGSCAGGSCVIIDRVCVVRHKRAGDELQGRKPVAVGLHGYGRATRHKLGDGGLLVGTPGCTWKALRSLREVDDLTLDRVAGNIHDPRLDGRLGGWGNVEADERLGTRSQDHIYRVQAVIDDILAAASDRTGTGTQNA